MEKYLSGQVQMTVWAEFEHKWQRWRRAWGPQGSPEEVDDFPEIKVGKRGVTSWTSLNEPPMNKFPQLKTAVGRGSEAQKRVDVFD